MMNIYGILLLGTLISVSFASELVYESEQTDSTPNKTTAVPTTTKSTTVTTETPKTTTMAPTNQTTTETTKKTTATSTTARVPTTPPTKPPAGGTGKWDVKSANHTCIKLNMDATIQLDNQDGNKSMTYVPTGAKSSGDCGGNASYITLKFENNNTQWELKFSFAKDKDGKVNVTDIRLNYTGALKGSAALHKNIFAVPKKMSFRCDNSQKIPQLHGSPSNVTLITENFQVQAFLTKDDFDDAVACEEDKVTNNIVPIAVGAALAGLVVIVLVAYLIGRRRNRTGYESV